ncbi:hypothetical protein EC988_006703, partial [Linderina pennispora]
MTATLSVSTAGSDSTNLFVTRSDSQQSTSPDSSTSTAHSTVICTPVTSLQQSLHSYDDDDNDNDNDGGPGAIPMASMREAFGGYMPAVSDDGALSAQKDHASDVQHHHQQKQKLQRLQKLTTAEFDKLHCYGTTEPAAGSRDYHADAAAGRDSSSQSGDETSYVRHPTLVFDGSPILRASVLVDSARGIYEEDEDREVHGFTIIPRLRHDGTSETFVESDTDDVDDHMPLVQHHSHRPSMRPRSYTDIPAHRPAHDNPSNNDRGNHNKNNS